MVSECNAMERNLDAFTTESAVSPPYEVALRVIGGWLDDEQPAQFSILEVPHGFIVIVQREDKDPDRRETSFTVDELVTRDVQSKKSRGRRRKPSDSGGRQVSRQDLLRALGHELEGNQGRMIVLDQYGEELLLTYSFVNAMESYAWHKSLRVIGLDEAARAVQAAHSRRQANKGLFGGLRRRS